MTIRHQFFPENKLFVQKYSGDWSVDDYAGFVYQQFEEKKIEGLVKVFTDLRSVTNLVEAFKSLTKLQEIRKTFLSENFLNVQLVDKPSSTAIIHLYQEGLSENNKYYYCSTVIQALKILQLSESISEIEMEDRLMNLKFQY